MNHSMLCTTCGTEYPDAAQLPALCIICNDNRQYITENGQQWTSPQDLASNHTVRITKLKDQLHCFKVQPDFGIANRALLVQSPAGNVLWDCIPLLDQVTIDYILALGGLQAIAISHPHYYSNMNVWAATFNCPIYIHENDKQWIMYDSAEVDLWKGNLLELWDGIKIIHTGGHFPGSCILQVPSLSFAGTILTGDSLLISRSRRHIAVMYSYPNAILLHRDEFAAFYRKISGLKFDSMYSAFDNQDLDGNAHQIFVQSMQRYLDSYGL